MRTHCHRIADALPTQSVHLPFHCCRHVPGVPGLQGAQDSFSRLTRSDLRFLAYMRRSRYDQAHPSPTLSLPGPFLAGRHSPRARPRLYIARTGRQCPFFDMGGPAFVLEPDRPPEGRGTARCGDYPELRSGIKTIPKPVQMDVSARFNKS